MFLVNNCQGGSPSKPISVSAHTFEKTTRQALLRHFRNRLCLQWQTALELLKVLKEVQALKADGIISSAESKRLQTKILPEHNQFSSSLRGFFHKIYIVHACVTQPPTSSDEDFFARSQPGKAHWDRRKSRRLGVCAITRSNPELFPNLHFSSEKWPNLSRVTGLL